MTTASLRLKLSPTVQLSEVSAEEMLLQSPLIQMPLKKPHPGVAAALRLLANGGATDPELREFLSKTDGGTFPFFTMFSRLLNMGFISHTVESDGTPLATVVPATPYYRLFTDEIAPDAAYQLSRFAFLHRAGEKFLLECPLGYAQVYLHHWQANALIHLLAEPQTCSSLAQAFPAISEAGAKMLYKILLSAKAISPVTNQITEEDHDATLRQWDFHDLLFHTRSRTGRHANAFGGNYRFLGEIDPLPNVKAPMSEQIIPLYQPDLEAVKAHEPAFSDVMEQRISIRQHGTEPITAQEIGEFLYRTARQISSFNLTLEKGDQQQVVEHSKRPYPNGGASYELELYLTIAACDGLEAGLYHYDPANHQLEFLLPKNANVDNLLRDVVATYDPTMQSAPPQVLITYAARFQRISWKYDALAYAVILKNVGVLQQTMYLVATAMGLAPCALGGGNSDLFAGLIKSSYYAETSVGEFMLGRKAESQH